jgi:TonB family protein
LSFLALLLAAAQAASAAPAPAVDARVVGGYVSDADYPNAALRARRGGHTATRLLVTARGRVGQCQIARSSGHPDLDQRTCVIAGRLRFRAARDAAGQPTEQWQAFDIRWTPPGHIRVEGPKPEVVR